ncbi:MAG: hypothetical protein KKH94_01915 [Candidatus Omnitrophica bacterium]|nr:hypothetical protein [Candidatus Omnitrophota bacterium]
MKMNVTTESSTINVVEILEAHNMAKLAASLAKFNISLQEYCEGPKPLYELRYAGNKEVEKVCSLKKIFEKIRNNGKEGLTLQRYKGLGEMNPGQLWETTMDPDRRRILKVMLDDAVAADEIFTVLMGDNVEPRRQFIERYAKSVRNLDV